MYVHKSGLELNGSQMNVLVLGSGFVCAPAVEYLSSDKNVAVTVGSMLQEDFAKLNVDGGLVNKVVVDVVNSPDEVDKLVASNDLVVSLLPNALHPVVAKLCIKHRKHMMSTSYLSPEMAELNDQATEAGITVMNEVGLDPGIDHLLAMECIDQIHERGGKVTSFISYCGGLPAPENSDSPLKYKFSWSPKDALLALLRPAKFLSDEEVIETSGDKTTMDLVEPMSFFPEVNLVGYPNRDSTIYAKLYGIEEAKTVLRGTLRYQGFVEAFRALKEVGLINGDPSPLLTPDSGPEITWKQFLATLLGKKQDISKESLRKLISVKFGADPVAVNVLDGLGLLSDDVVVKKRNTPLDTLSWYLSTKLAYNPGERDLVILRHDVAGSLPDGSEENHHIDLVMYGKHDGHSAMASSVGYTAAIVAKMILTGEIQQKGVVLPLTKDIYVPVLRKLAKLGIAASSYLT